MSVPFDNEDDTDKEENEEDEASHLLSDDRTNTKNEEKKKEKDHNRESDLNPCSFCIDGENKIRTEGKKIPLESSSSSWEDSSCEKKEKKASLLLGGKDGIRFDMCRLLLPKQYSQVLEILEKYHITVVFLYLVPRHTKRMQTLLTFLLHHWGVKVVSLRFRVPFTQERLQDLQLTECLASHSSPSSFPVDQKERRMKNGHDEKEEE
ncbi:methyltransferase domain protein, partial [Cystoisospora suis]